MKQLQQNYWTILLIIAFIFFFTVSGCLSVDSEAEPPDNPGKEKPDLEEEDRRLEEEWQRRNEELKEELGSYYVPLPPLNQPDNPPEKVRGIYLTGHSVGYAARYEQILQLIDETELNAVVIDIKDDLGKMSYRSDIEAVNELEAFYNPHLISDIKGILKDLNERGIYTIARIVAFRDGKTLPAKKPEWCIPLKSGGLYRDSRGFAWGNAYIEELWDYNIAIAKEAALLGFREIQFDYIRFPDSAAYVDRVAHYPGSNGRTKAEAIRGFIEKARQELAPYNVHVAYDVFGVIASSWGDTDDIGQCWEDFAASCDYICPMIYPSHYYPNQNWFGLRFPDTNPTVTITGALSDAIKRSAAVENPAIIRPWLQAFTAKWIGSGRYIHYGAAQIREQINAALALGIEEYMLWDPQNRNYPREAFYSEAEAERLYEQSLLERESKGYDFLGRTPRKAAEAYLEAIQKLNWREAYALQHGFQADGNAYRDWLKNGAGKLQEWRVGSIDNSKNAATVSLSISLNLRGEEITLADERWKLLLENKIWRINPSAKFLDLIAGAEVEK